jgi:hypothetical protein
MGGWFSKKNEKNKILADKEFRSILNDLKIKDVILKDKEITKKNLIEKIFSAIEKKYESLKNEKPKKYTTDIINDLSKFRDKVADFKNKFMEKNEKIYGFILSELMKLDKIIIDLQEFLENKPNNAPNSAANSAATPAANSGANPEAKSKANPEANPEATPVATPAANSGANPEATPVANSGSNNAATIAATPAATPAAKSKANSGANPEATPTAKSKAISAATLAATSGSNSGATSAANSTATNATKSNKKATSKAPTTENIQADPDKIFEKIEEFEKKFFKDYFEVRRFEKGKQSTFKAKMSTTKGDILRFLEVLLLYKKLFPTDKPKDIINLINKYYNLCQKVEGEKCILGIKLGNTKKYSEKDTSEEYKKLMYNINKKTKNHISSMLTDILPNNKPANNNPVNNPNNKIKHENINNIWKNIETIEAILDRLQFFSFSEKNKNNKTVKTIQQKFLDFIKFLLLFKKIIKDKNKNISSTIDEWKKKYLKRCGTSKDEKNEYPMNTNDETLRKRCKSEKTIGDHGRSIYQLINFDKKDNKDNVDKKFKKLLEIGWENDEFNNLKDEFNSMLQYYYKFINKNKKRVNEEVMIE